jgi:hypothetical protein
MSPRALRVLAAVYLAKTLIVGIVWMSAPDLPRRAWERIRQTFTAADPASRGDREPAP